MRIYLTVRKPPSLCNLFNYNQNNINAPFEKEEEQEEEEEEKVFLVDLNEQPQELQQVALNHSRSSQNKESNSTSSPYPWNQDTTTGTSLIESNLEDSSHPQQQHPFHSESASTTFSTTKRGKEYLVGECKEEQYVDKSKNIIIAKGTCNNNSSIEEQPSGFIKLFPAKEVTAIQPAEFSDIDSTLGHQPSESLEGESSVHSNLVTSAKRPLDFEILNTTSTTASKTEDLVQGLPSLESITTKKIKPNHTTKLVSTMGLSRSLGDYYASQLKTVGNDTSSESNHNNEEYISNPAFMIQDSTMMRDTRRNSNPRINSTSNMTLLERHHVQNDTEDSNVSKEFLSAMKKRGLEVVVQKGDGNCLFRAVSLQVYGDSDSHMDVRRRCLDFMAKDEEHFAPFIQDEPFDEYIRRKRQNGEHGNNVEIQAISELFNRPVEVYIPQHGAEPINIFQSDYKTSDIPIRLSYHDGNHYNAVIDPLIPTAGLGLGLPNLEPGLADKLQMQQAVDESYRMHMQHVIDEENEKEIQLAIKESLACLPSSRSDENSLAPSDYWSRKKAAVYGLRNDIEETDFDLEQSALLNSIECQKMESCLKPSGDTKKMSSKLSYSHWRSDRSRSTSPHDHPPSTAYNTVSLPSSSFASAHASSINLDQDSWSDQILQNQNEYPQVVQELVMNGFELASVLKAYNLCGDNFDSMLAFLVSTTGNRL